MSWLQVLRQSSHLLQTLTARHPAGIRPALSRIESTSAGPELFGGQTLEEIRARIFGNHIGNGLPSGRKVLRRKLRGEKIATYYGVGSRLERSDPFFEPEDAEKNKLKLDKMKRRGKAPPKKGQGKRASKKR